MLAQAKSIGKTLCGTMMLRKLLLPGHKAVLATGLAGRIISGLLSLKCMLWLAVPAVAMAVTFTASLDRDTIGMGESVTLTLKFEDGRPTTDISIPPVDGLSVNYIGPQSYSQTDLNTGKTLSSVSYVFNLTPGRAGQFVIPAITVNA